MNSGGLRLCIGGPSDCLGADLEGHELDRFTEAFLPVLHMVKLALDLIKLTLLLSHLRMQVSHNCKN